MISLEGLTLATGRARRGRLHPPHLRPLRPRRPDPQPVPRGRDRGPLPHRRRHPLVLPRPRPLPAESPATAATLRQLLPSCSTSSITTAGAPASASASTRPTACSARGPRATSSPGWTPRSSDWVVTPRRGKAVEINALWYNALRLLEALAPRRGSRRRRRRADRRGTPSGPATRSTAASGTSEGGYLYDVVDGDDGDDPACRPNQVFAISLPHPVLDRSRWEPVARGRAASAC